MLEGDSSVSFGNPWPEGSSTNRESTGPGAGNFGVENYYWYWFINGLDTSVLLIGNVVTTLSRSISGSNSSLRTIAVDVAAVTHREFA